MRRGTSFNARAEHYGVGPQQSTHADARDRQASRTQDDLAFVVATLGVYTRRCVYGWCACKQLCIQPAEGSALGT